MHDLAVRQRGVVVRNLAQARRIVRHPTVAAAWTGRASGSGASMRFVGPGGRPRCLSGVEPTSIAAQQFPRVQDRAARGDIPVTTHRGSVKKNASVINPGHIARFALVDALGEDMNPKPSRWPLPPPRCSSHRPPMRRSRSSGGTRWAANWATGSTSVDKGFNDSQKDYKVVPVYKGTYPETRDRRHRRVPRRQGAADRAGVRGRHGDLRPAAPSSRWPGDEDRQREVRPASTCRWWPGTTPSHTVSC